ncbi:MAG: filamentous hemagglutinin N-terminal domain-containing protein [Burkholderiaceae bacterium]|nr:filamentous hemagglutinin N-terminal domain-containing protein [Burkholderiaceae bacterium]
MNDKYTSRKPCPRLSTPIRLGVAAVAACFIAAPTLANPENPLVVNGTASFNQVGTVLTVTNSNGAIINWDKFSIQAGETTHFAQAAASSTVLNRVLNDPSAIYGTLSSNGRVWLVNPAGIMVGPGGRVDTAGFVASTLSIRNEDFLAGRNLFVNSGGAGNVVNQGEIRTPAGGSVYLIGSNVSNEGIITTPQGETILAAGATVSLIDSATPGVKVDITGAAGNSTNLGSITAEAGRIGIAGVIVRNSGTLNASSVVSDGGRIFLKASQDAYVDGNGRIVTTGTKGGSVEVLGNRVAVMDNASIDASGVTGGGRILVGGDYQGKNPEIQNASITFFGQDATLKADATEVGDGGTVIVWADDTTRAYGSISARGGASGGDGGFVETSGKRYLDFDARVDTRAPLGNVGTLLLDPDHMLVTDAVGGDINIYSAYGGSIFTSASDNPSTLHWSQIASALSSTAVNVYTSYGGDISFQQSALWSYTSSNDLTFTSSGMIGGNWGGVAGGQPATGLMLTNTSTGGIYFYGDQGVNLGNGSIKTGGTGSITSSNGSIGIGYFESLLSFSASAKYSIWDNNWQTPGAVNIYSNGAISLTSTLGAANLACIGGWCSAIQADTGGTPTSISATVTGSAPNGGIGIRHHGSLPASVNLTDNSTTPAYNEISFETSGDMTLGAGHSFTSYGGGIHLDAGGNMTVAGANFYGSPIERTFFAAGNLTVNQALSVSGTGSFLGLAAGSTISVNQSLNASSGDIGMVTGVSKASLDTVGDYQLGSGLIGPQLFALAGNAGTINVNSGVYSNNMYVGSGTLNVNSSGYLYAGNLMAVLGGTVNVNNYIDAGYMVLGAGTLNVGNIGSLYATNQFVGLVGGNATIAGGSIKTGSGDLELLVGGTLNINNGGGIWAGYNALSAPLPDASIAVGGDLVLNNGGHIKAADDVFLDLLGPTSTLVLNDGTPGYAPSYVLSDAVAVPVSTTHITFLSRNSGGIKIDGIESTITKVGGSGFFAGNLSTPALPGAGLAIVFAAQANDSVAAQLANDILGAATKASVQTPTGGDVPGLGGGGPKGSKPGVTAGGEKGSFGGDDEDEDKKDGKKSDKDQSEKKDDKPAKKKLAQCT